MISVSVSTLLIVIQCMLMLPQNTREGLILILLLGMNVSYNTLFVHAVSQSYLVLVFDDDLSFFDITISVAL